MPIHGQSGRFPGRMNASCRGVGQAGRLRAQPSTRPLHSRCALFTPGRSPDSQSSPLQGRSPDTPSRLRSGRRSRVEGLASGLSDYRCGCSAGLVAEPRTCFPFHSRREAPGNTCDRGGFYAMAPAPHASTAMPAAVNIKLRPAARSSQGSASARRGGFRRMAAPGGAGSRQNSVVMAGHGSARAAPPRVSAGSAPPAGSRTPHRKADWRR